MMAKAEIKAFNIRVYGLIVNDRQEVLLSDEYRMNMKMTKFPGGGLIPGEGTLDALQREMREELGQEVSHVRHFYTTDFFQQALFYEDQQLISIYYMARLSSAPSFPISTVPYDFELIDEAPSFRWKKIKEISENDVSMPIDKVVTSMLQKTNH